MLSVLRTLYEGNPPGTSRFPSQRASNAELECLRLYQTEQVAEPMVVWDAVTLMWRLCSECLYVEDTPLTCLICTDLRAHVAMSVADVLALNRCQSISNHRSELTVTSVRLYGELKPGWQLAIKYTRTRSADDL